MKTKEELEATAYGIWLTIIKPDTNPLAVMFGHTMLELIFWQLDIDIFGASKLLENALQLSKQHIVDDCITDPIAIIKRDVASRREALKQAMNAGNN